jgi:hypothetical protein
MNYEEFETIIEESNAELSNLRRYFMSFDRISFSSVVGLSDEKVFFILYSKANDLMRSFVKTSEGMWHRNCVLVSMVPFEYRMFILGSTLDSEINNGGFIQYFSNHLGDMLQALKMVGAMGAYEVFKKAVEQFSHVSHIFWAIRYADEKSIELNCDIHSVENYELEEIFSKYDIEYDYCDDKPLSTYFVEYAHANSKLYFK